MAPPRYEYRTKEDRKLITGVHNQREAEGYARFWLGQGPGPDCYTIQRRRWMSHEKWKTVKEVCRRGRRR